ncbi:MAG: hypothetical protein A2175_02170 [Candidatus Nealsonbacteria bacterium RBG_13_42_11]|uniref:RNA polymerase sigma-70 region 4 domain-containing protein n=1 Tax=Candidatus Nealsonbacteria bacterium RBG_13_42_11 TaxID=1801663 RepID=A0A1G2DZE2_9BACT|nr:MAG: hypothetical protein A2175_02170 [Candidatus Nealsonbacteria bacterium RBG_13_42_11]
MKSKFDYSKICSNFLKVLPQKQREIISRRFALGIKKAGKEKIKGETLESIGESFGVTRERVRQIEEDGFFKLKPEIKKYQEVFNYLYQYLKKQGGLKKEDALLADLAGSNSKSQILFLLTLGEQFQRIAESKNFHSFWTTENTSLSQAEKTISQLSEKLEKKGKPLNLKEVKQAGGSNQNVISFLEISKTIQKNSEGLWGLSNWPEINPRGVKDKAYLVFKKENKPLHFTAVAELIGPALPQTVHNELIKDPRFILVGRGTYALEEWGYEKGVVKDVIAKILKEARKPLNKEEILEKTLEQRFVKENTVLLNLSNKKYFLKNSQGDYTIREA